VPCHLATASTASAATFRWQVPEGCPDASALERETERVLGEPLARYPIEVTGVVSGAAGQWSLSLHIAAHAEVARVRELQAASCQELMEAAAVATALAAADSGKTQPTLTPAAPAALVSPAPPPAAAASRPREVSSHFQVSASALSSFGSLPAPGLGGELQLAWLSSWFRVGIGLSWLPARDMALERGASGSFGLYFADVLLCAGQQVESVRLWGCGVAELGQMSAHVQGSSLPDARHTAWRALGVRASLTYALAGPLELAVSLAAMAPLTRPQFIVHEGESRQVHEPARLDARLLIGLSFLL